MGTLEGPHKREKVKQYLTRDLREHEVGPYLVARRAGKSALMGPFEGPIGGLNRDPKDLHWDSSKPGPIGACKRAPSAPLEGPNGALIRALWVL
jgi:hypothetical protein